jgi:hypothetical protein
VTYSGNRATATAALVVPASPIGGKRGKSQDGVAMCESFELAWSEHLVIAPVSSKPKPQEDDRVGCSVRDSNRNQTRSLTSVRYARLVGFESCVALPASGPLAVARGPLETGRCSVRDSNPGPCRERAHPPSSALRCSEHVSFPDPAVFARVSTKLSSRHKYDRVNCRTGKYDSLDCRRSLSGQSTGPVRTGSKRREILVYPRIVGSRESGRTPRKLSDEAATENRFLPLYLKYL